MNDFSNEPLFNYLNRADSTFRWKEVGRKQHGRGGTIIHLELHSQVWQGIPWKHQLLIIDPETHAQPSATGQSKVMLYVTGSYDGGMTAQFLSLFAEATGAVMAILYDVPNQPLFEGLSEDALIAFTFSKYLETEDATWPLLFPMVRSVAAAMTALQQYEGGLAQGPPSEFIVTGASKRGWTSWLAGACDPRVCAIAPMVYNNLNLPAQAQRQLDSWGDYSDEISDYVEAGLMDHLRTAQGQQLIAMVDPYSFRDRLTLPKLLINGTNDRYWPLDAASYYYDELPGDKNLLYVPNSGHNLEDFNRVGRTTAAFYKTIAAGRSFP
ncbi:MAG: PhoPQ-activated pathogenicity-related family protein, partial [Armatimonadota bacterium]|nr:PhoPQ-activated pathogenicity-related family protein [Armatimonadota bacterium]